MAASMKSLGIDRLSIEERLALVQELWDSIAAENAPIPLTEALRKELDQRLADHEARPSEVVSWEEIRASISNRLKE